MAPSSALPIGAKRKVDACKLFPVDMTRANLQHRLLALTHAQMDRESAEALDYGEEDPFQVFSHSLNVAAFVWITEVDELRQRLTILSPSALPQIRTNILLLGDSSLYWKE